ncbi:MAG: LAGLIDADG family homing endonuclease [Candidatus Micrarchaeota archaeon]
MQLNEDLAEVIGAFIGDGCISSYYEGERRRSVVLFTGNWKNDRVYYRKTIVPAIRKEFGGKRIIYHRKDDNSLRYVLCDRTIISFFLKSGMPVGVKGNKLKVPIEIRKSERLAKACIRGIFNTDGSIYRRYSKKYSNHSACYRNYAVIQFKMESRSIIRWIKTSLETHGIRVNRIIKTSNCRVIRITNQDGVRRFYKDIGFTHPYHERRYRKITGVG